MHRRCPEPKHGEAVMKSATKLGKILLGTGLTVALGFAIADGSPALAQTWTQLLPSGTPPLVRSHHGVLEEKKEVKETEPKGHQEPDGEHGPSQQRQGPPPHVPPDNDHCLVVANLVDRINTFRLVGPVTDLARLDSE